MGFAMRMGFSEVGKTSFYKENGGVGRDGEWDGGDRDSGLR